MQTANLRRTVLLLIAAVMLTHAWVAQASIRQRVTERSWEAATPGDSLRFRLPDRWIDPGSVLVLAGEETLLVTRDYRLEANEGLILLLKPLARGPLRVEYDVVPLAIPRVYQSIIPPDTLGESRAPIPPKGGKVRALAETARLELRGSKTVSLEVGSGADLTVRQSLDVSLAGEIADGVTVRGVLSDRKTPLQAEGRTTELSDLDRIYLEIDGPGAGMRLGDFQLRGPPGLFTGYQRQLEGILLTGERGEGELLVAAATLPGEFVTVEFLAEEGKQGPYRLHADDPTFDAVVLAGSEIVWVDGEKLVRGEDRDYVIDYSASTVSFTGRRPVNGASRITVDFQISSQPYQRNAYAAQIGWGSAIRGEGGRFGFRANLFSERDDRSRPIGGPLSDREKEILRDAGDSLTVGFGSGIDCGGLGHGDYEQVEADSLDRPFFRYVGPDSGTCNIRFDEVGDRRGDYTDSLLTGGETIYRFVGYQQGRYQPGRAVPRPSRRDLLNLSGIWIGPAGIRVGVDAAGSYDDPNTFSDRDDSDRSGGALQLSLRRDPLPVRLAGRALGRWGVQLESRDIDNRFRSISRIDPGWYGYEWGIAGDRLGKGDRRRRAELTHQPGFGFSLSGTFESLSNRSDLEGERTRLRILRAGRLYGSAERLRGTTHDRAGETEVEGNREIDEFRLGSRLEWFEGEIGLRRDRDTKGCGPMRTGLGFDEWILRTAYIHRGGVGRVELSRTERQDRRVAETEWTDADRAETWQAKAAWSPTGRLLELQYTRRDLRRELGGTTRSDLASLLWSQTQAAGRFGQQIRADLNTTQEEGRIKSIEYVGEGRGRYDSLGVFVGTGDYDLVLRSTDQSQLQRRLEASWRVDLAPGRGREPAETPLGKVWRSSQWLLFATFSARTTDSVGRFWQSLPDLLLAREDGVPLAAHKIRAEGSSLPRARWLSPRIGYRRERSREELFTNVQTAREKEFYSLILRSLPAEGWTIEQEIRRELENESTRLSDRESAQGSLGWRSLLIRLAGWWRPDAAVTVRLSLDGRTRERIPNDERYGIIQLTPGFQWNPQKRTRLDVRVTRSWVDGPESRLLGLETAGWEGRGNLSMRLHGSLDGSIVAEVRSPDGGTTQTNLRAEMRALF